MTLAFVGILSSFYWKVLFKKTIDPEFEKKVRDKLNRFQSLWYIQELLQFRPNVLASLCFSF